MADLVYTPPRVSVQEETAVVPNRGVVSVLPPSRVALVGPGVGYQTFTEAIVLTGTTPVTLSKTGVDDSTIVVSSLAGAEYTETTDWVSATTGAVPEEAVTTVARTGGGTITTGDTVYVTYEYTDSAYYLPYLSGDLDLIQARFGPAIDTTTGLLASPLSLAAKIVLEQGAPDVVIVPTKGSIPSSVTAAQINTAYANLASRTDVGVVIPLPVGIAGTDGTPGDTTTVATDLALHCAQMSALGLSRMGVLGYDTTSTRSPDVVAALVANQRIVVVSTSLVDFYNGYSRATEELGGMYVAAAVGGMMGNLPPAEPLTRKNVRSFSGIPARKRVTMTVSEMNRLAATGVLVVESDIDNRLFVRHGITSDMSSILTREISVVRAKDAHVRVVQRIVEASGIIGRGTDDDTPADVQGLIEGALTQCIALGLFVRFNGLTVRPNESDPTIFDVRYNYNPIFPLNEISMVYSINTVTGNVQEAAA